MSNRQDARTSWRTATLQELVYFQRGYDITKADQKPGEIPVVSSSGINSHHSEAKADGPGVVIGRKGSLGTVHYIEGPYWPHDTTLWSRDLKGNNARYVYYFLQTLGLQRYDVGNSNPTLNRNHIHSLEIKIPEYHSQERIAAILSAYDDLIETNRRRMALLEQAARLLYREWFVHLHFPGHDHGRVVDGVPEGWERKRIDKVAETVGGGTPSTVVSDYWDGDITWVVPSDVTKNDGIVLLDSERKITEKGLRESSARLVPANTILMTSRASVGFFALMDREVCTNQGFINVIPHEGALRMYLLFNLMYRVDEIRSNAKGSTYPEINKSTFRGLSVIVPPIEICREFAAVIGPMIGQIRNIKKQVVNLAQARDLLLPRLMSGEIVV